jgi:hypothetical protein
MLDSFDLMNDERDFSFDYDGVIDELALSFEELGR